ncbi:MAG TPA: helical backbone metal receptor [Gemmatimonadales bacterium]|nr:helical backbone metal receptor [Gemmatimonadales bacterium]
MALLLGAAGCKGEQEPVPTPLLAVDDLGDTVRLAAPATRIVSLIPATTELLFALGLGERVVGRTTWCDFPAEAREVPSLGDGLQPNLEAIVATRPDLVVLYNSSQNVAAAERLRAQQIPTLLVNTDHLADVPRLARLLAPLAGDPAAGDSLALHFVAELDSATVRTPTARQRVLILAWDQPPIAIGAGSFLSELVERAGARNVFDDLEAPSAPVSMEAIASREVDAILVLGDTVPPWASRPEWQAVGAVREHRFLFVPADLFSRPSPRSPAALRALVTALDTGAPS